MAVLQPRMRVVMFRISEPEYELIRSACETSGARSFSDFARSAVLTQAAGSHPSADAVVDLQRRVQELEHRLETLTSQVGRPPRSAASPSHF